MPFFSFSAILGHTHLQFLLVVVIEVQFLWVSQWVGTQWVLGRGLGLLGFVVQDLVPTFLVGFFVVSSEWIISSDPALSSALDNGSFLLE